MSARRWLNARWLEITVGQHAVRAEGARPSDLDSSHTPPALLARWLQPNRLWSKPYLFHHLNHLLTGVDAGKHSFFITVTYKCLIFLEIIAAVWQIPFIRCSKVLSHTRVMRIKSWPRPELGWILQITIAAWLTKHTGMCSSLKKTVLLLWGMFYYE